jgi:hypothetical protein
MLENRLKLIASYKLKPIFKLDLHFFEGVNVYPSLQLTQFINDSVQVLHYLSHFKHLPFFYKMLI